MRRLSIIFCALLLGVTGMKAQDPFNPQNPDDPQVPVFYYPLTVSCTPAGGAYTSGNGRYAPGTTVTVNTSPKAGYTFNHWELNGEPYEATTTQFSYTTVEGKMDFVAVYDFQPNDPNDPLMDVKSRLYLASEPEEVCTFNRTSGAWTEAEQYVSVDVTGVDQQYEFIGWWLNGTKLTEVKAFNHLMGIHDETLVAHFRQLPFTPANPDEPQMSEWQTDVQTHAKGDANEDGVVNVADAVAVINVYLTGDASTVNFSLADTDGNGIINVADAVYIINLYLTRECRLIQRI